MKKYLASGMIAAAAAAAATSAYAQPVENSRPPVFATQESYGDTSQSAPEANWRSEPRDGTARTGRPTRPTGSGAWMYDSHNPEANSAKWGVG